MSLANDTYQAFRALALECNALPERKLAPLTYRWRLEHWLSDFVLTRHFFPEETFDHVLAFQPAFHRAEGNHKREFRGPRGVNSIIFALNSRNQTIKLLGKLQKRGDIHILKRPEYVASIANSRNDFGFAPIGSMDALITRLEVAVNDGITKLAGPIVRASGGENAMNVKVLVQTRLRAWLWQRLSDEIQLYQNYLDPGILKFAFAQHEALTFPKGKRSIAFYYNHIVVAPSPKSRDFRQGAFSVMRSVGIYFEKCNEFWQAIDDGESIHAVLARELKVKPSTIRHFFKEIDPLEPLRCDSDGAPSEVRLRQFLPYLDYVDPALWPRSKEEATYFTFMADYIGAYAKAIVRAPQNIMRNVLHDLAVHDLSRWEGIFKKRLAKQFAVCKTKKENERDKRRKRRNDDSPIIIPPSNALAQFKTEVSNIGDMTNDLNNRVILPLIVVAIETRGFEVLKLSLIQEIKDYAVRKFWMRATPSEMVAASSYWHSARVNIWGRFASVARTTEFTQWKTLINAPYTIDLGQEKATLVPLASTVALAEEGKIMDHCVRSYSADCLGRGYHLFSIRSTSGERLSTLCYTEDPSPEGIMKIRLSQNLSLHNAEAPPLAQKVASEFMGRVNQGKLKIDWAAIVDSKAGFLCAQVDETIGYDFHDAKKRSYVYEVYSPMVPRSIPGIARRDTEKLAEYLGIQETVDIFLEGPGGNHMETGFLKRKPTPLEPEDRPLLAAPPYLEANL